MAKKRHKYNEPSKNGKNDDDLILGQNGQQDEQMKFRDNDDSRPDQGVERDLERGDTSFDKVDFPDASEEYRNYEELLASEEYKDALDKLEEFTGERNIGTGTSGRYAILSNQSTQILREIYQAEINHHDELEELCERIIRDHFKIPENSLQFNFKLNKEGVKVQNTPTKQQLKQQEEELSNDINDLTPERAKRRLINAMTQGHSVDSTYIFNAVSDELSNIMGVDNIAEKYSIFVSTMMLGYWQFPEEMMNAAMGSGGEGEGSGAGKAKIDTSTNPPTINAEAVIFPFLIHEAIKGVMEYLGKERDPEDEEKYQKAMDLEDQLQHEIWDIRLGPAIWRRLSKAFPRSVIENEEKRKIQFYMYSNIANLPVKQFLVLMKEVLKDTEDGKALLSAMYYDLTMVIDDEQVTKETSHFKNKMDEVMKNHQENDESVDDILGSLGISLSND